MTRPSPRPRPRPVSPPVDDTEQTSGPDSAGPDVLDGPDVVDGSDGTGSRPTRVGRRQHAARSRRSRRWRGAALLTAAVLVVALALVVAVTVIRRNVGEAAPVANGGSGSSSTNYPEGSAVLADQTAAESFVAGATSAITAVTAYDYRDLDSALSAGLAVTTGTYRTAYRAALQGSLGESARRDELVQTFETFRAGIGEMSDDRRTATVLIFGAATVTSGDDAGATRTIPRTLTATVVSRGDRFLISRLVVGANAGLPPGSPQLAVAAEAGRRQLLALLSYRRSAFDADAARAVAGAVDPLRSTVAASTAGTRARMDEGNYDLTGAVTAVAVERASGTSVDLLVAATGYRVSDTGMRTVDNDARVTVQVVRAGGQWKVREVQPVAG